jgi:hypothetical protein
MFALEFFGLLIGLAVLVAIVRRRGETKTNCGPLDPCLGGKEKHPKESAAQSR